MAASPIDTSREYALDRDAADPLAKFRDEFALPAGPEGETQHYLCGHSLGALPKAARGLIDRELGRWAERGAEGHFDGADGWYAYHERFAAPLARLLGADANEVVAMNGLTVNLHLMLISFFAPEGDRSRILIEKNAFPSDRFAVQSHLRLHGLDPESDLVEIGAGRLSAESLEAALEAEAGRVALVLLPGVQYLDGKAPDLAACADVARRHGCRIGFDLAHAIGNLDLDLRRSEPDFAVWCSYKYLNGGPGAIGGCFVNRRWTGEKNLPRLEGWWGHDKATRFRPVGGFQPIPSAEAWQLSNPPILAMLPLEASLTLFDAAGIDRLRDKSVALTGYLESLLLETAGDAIELMTPAEPAGRGAQLSIRLTADPDRTSAIVDALRADGVIADWRAPDVIRLAPVPLYNSFADVHAAASSLAATLVR